MAVGLLTNRAIASTHSKETRRAQAGMTYLGILFFVMIVGAGLAAVGELWATASLREKESDLLAAGRELKAAIGRYYAAGAGTPQRYPSSLGELLKDSRVPGIRRHLRRIPIDPMTGSNDWGTVQAPGGGIVGVFSKSDSEPIKKTGFEHGEEGFDGATKYSDWRFVFVTTPRNR